MTYLLDTSFIINYFKKGGDWAQDLVKLMGNRSDQLAISVITYGELCYGVTRSVNPEKEQEKIEDFLNDFLVEIKPVTAQVVLKYAKLKREAELGGFPLDDFDLLIGATAVIGETRLVTDNKKHFSKICESILWNTTH